MSTGSGTKHATGLIGALVRSMRPHQWTKNLLVFVPIMTSHRWRLWDLWPPLCLVAVAFCLMASGLYVFNDMMDVEMDRVHPTKCRRPLAAGLVTLPQAGLLMLALVVLALLAAAAVSRGVVGLVFCYALASATYSRWLKRIAIVDVVTLSLFYVFRIFVGGECAGASASDWLLTFAFFLFLSLATSKRFSEMVGLELQGTLSEDSLKFRGYDRQDTAFIQILGVGAAIGSTVVLCLYLQSDTVHKLYRTPRFFWIAIPIFTCWISHLWRVAVHGQLKLDPLTFLLRDPASYLAMASVVVLAWLAGPL